MESAARALTSAIKAEAHRLGFELVGVTTPEPPPHIQTYEEWLDAGRHASMGYLNTEPARARRADPHLILPECQSILVLGIRYDNPLKAESGESSKYPLSSAKMDRAESRGRVAAYAWGDDYHLVLPPRLEALLVFIQEQAGRKIAHRYYTDTGPILERDLAQRAGLGWIGKNTCLINPREGSYFLLAEILLALALEADHPFQADLCGTCTRCIQACPTGCIRADRTLEAGRCISYLTIENKAEIPADLRPLQGDWIFGCDVCQMVCPWNIRFARENGDPGLAPQPDMPYPALSDEMKLTPREFNTAYKRSPIRRAKRRGYLRNVAVALGNRGERSSLPVLREALDDEEELVKGHARWAISRIEPNKEDG